MNGNTAAPPQAQANSQPHAQAQGQAQVAKPQQQQQGGAPNATVAQLKKQLNDPHDAFFIGLAFRKERELHSSNEKCLDQLNKLTLIMNAKQKAKTDDPNWKLNIYQEYIRSPLSATAYLSPHIANPQNSPAKPQQPPAQQNPQQPNNNNNNAAQQNNNNNNQNPPPQNKQQPTSEQNPKQPNQQQSSQQPNQSFWVQPYSNDNSPQKDQQKPNQQNNQQQQGSVPPQNSANKPNDPSGQPNKNPQSQQQPPQQQQQQQQQQQPTSGKTQPVSGNQQPQQGSQQPQQGNQQPQQGNNQNNPNGNQQQPQQGNNQNNPNGNQQQQQQPQKQNNDYSNPQQKGNQPPPQNTQQPVGNGAANGHQQYQQQPQNGGSQHNPQQNQYQGQNSQPQQQQQQQQQPHQQNPANKDTNPNSANKQMNNNNEGNNSGKKQDDDICGICSNKVHASERITLKCDHDFHLNCLKKVVGKMLERGIYPIRCQAAKLCPYIITIDELTQIMPEESNKKLLQQCSSSYESNYGRVVQCPREKCGKRFLCSTPKESNVACAFCTEEICLVCFKARHYGLECDQSSRFKPHEFEQIVAENKKRMNQKCPNCSKTHKNDDCMECVKCQCGTRFCTICHSELAICQCHWYKALKSGSGQYDSSGRQTEPQNNRSRASTPSKNIPTGTSSQYNMNDSTSNHGGSEYSDHQLNPIQGNANRQAQLWSNSRGDQSIGGTPRSSLGSKYQLAKKQIHASQQQQLQQQQQQPTQDSQYPDNGVSPMRNSQSKDRPASRSRGMAVPLFPERGTIQQQNNQYQKQVQNDPYISSDYRQNVLPKLQNRRINNNEVFQQDTYEQYLQQQKAQRLQQAAQDPNMSNYNSPQQRSAAGGNGNYDNLSNGGNGSITKKSIFDDEERRSRNPTPSRVNDTRRFTPSQSHLNGQRDEYSMQY